ncbi:class I adenylate-forming enzyme family protein [Pontivivens insulae]|uniref:Long-chain-fatty-acid--CoA ligase n=1 Tax=Pontivivens insulae TaxID=1639689 RepID=A0A2R8AAW0_9RHOB|nr:class I adenylate-forming enzyme family protein [Pontivivens insulae]RED13269.1 acyl-coenzyme A synthetase/AMP-(fatty) acid ligase [Pontivivens insulae]SPF29361.1 Long-chain-fatty-acid--CoA ligase [Pontivivens insulae]
MPQSLIKSAPLRCPKDFNLAQHMLEGGGAAPDTVAVEVLSTNGVTRWTRAELNRAILGFAAAVQDRGLPPGARVILRLGDTIGFPLAFFGTIAAGYVPVPVSAMLTDVELAPMLRGLAPALVLADQGLSVPDLGVPIMRDDIVEVAQAFAPLPAPTQSAADDLAYILFTSGSGGRAKAVRHAHRAGWARKMMWDGWYGLTPRDRVLHAGAFNWSYTLGTGLTDPVAAGATALLLEGDRSPVRILAALRQSRATIFAAVPGVYRKILALGALPNLPDLRHGLSAGEALPPTLRAEWQRRLGIDIHEALGMTEVSTFLSSSPTHPAPEGTQGFAQPGRTLAVLDDDGIPCPRGTPGLLAIGRDDPGLMLGYDDVSLADDPWFVTSDLVEMREDGAFCYHGRRDDVMTAQGYRVSPTEVEAVLERHSTVTEAAVCEVEVRPGLRLIAAFIRGNVTSTELSEHCTTHLARYKWPRHFQRVDDLPRGATGKLLRRALPALYDPDRSLP